MSKTHSQHKPGVCPDNANKLHFDLLFISENFQILWIWNSHELSEWKLQGRSEVH